MWKPKRKPSCANCTRPGKSAPRTPSSWSAKSRAFNEQPWHTRDEKPSRSVPDTDTPSPTDDQTDHPIAEFILVVVIFGMLYLAFAIMRLAT